MTLNYKNSSIHYTIQGKGETIVLLHGFLESLEMWNELVPDLLKKHQVLCIDLLGHGQTDCLGYVHTMDDMANVVFEVLKTTKIETAHFIGHSMGGYVALALAEKKPLLFKSLCLMNSTFEADDDDLKSRRLRANKMAKANYENLVRMSFANLFAPKSKIRFEKEFEIALNIALNTSVQSYIAGQEGMRLRTDRFKMFKELNANKAIVIGEKDVVINANSLITKTKNTSIECIKLSEGHMSHIENKAELSYFLNRFVEK